MNKINLTDDDRFTIILEQIGSIERDREDRDDKSRHVKGSRTTDKDDFKRIKKIKRDHRRTRVIRTTPLEEEEESNSFQAIAEQSPTANVSSCADCEATPGDDRVKDPDWGQTPLRTRSKYGARPGLKKNFSGGNLRKTRSNSRIFSAIDINITNDENKV